MPGKQTHIMFVFVFLATVIQFVNPHAMTALLAPCSHPNC